MWGGEVTVLFAWHMLHCPVVLFHPVILTSFKVGSFSDKVCVDVIMSKLDVSHFLNYTLSHTISQNSDVKDTFELHC